MLSEDSGRERVMINDMIMVMRLEGARIEGL